MAFHGPRRPGHRPVSTVADVRHMQRDLGMASDCGQGGGEPRVRPADQAVLDLDHVELVHVGSEQPRGGVAQSEAAEQHSVRPLVGQGELGQGVLGEGLAGVHGEDSVDDQLVDVRTGTAAAAQHNLAAWPVVPGHGLHHLHRPLPLVVISLAGRSGVRFCYRGSRICGSGRAPLSDPSRSDMSPFRDFLDLGDRRASWGWHEFRIPQEAARVPATSGGPQCGVEPLPAGLSSPTGREARWRGR